MIKDVGGVKSQQIPCLIPPYLIEVLTDDIWGTMGAARLSANEQKHEIVD